jgi:hypothetical protein
MFPSNFTGIFRRIWAKILNLNSAVRDSILSGVGVGGVTCWTWWLQPRVCLARAPRAPGDKSSSLIQCSVRQQPHVVGPLVLTLQSCLLNLNLWIYLSSIFVSFCMVNSEVTQWNTQKQSVLSPCRFTFSIVKYPLGHLQWSWP